MIKQCLLFLFLILLFAACKAKREDLIARKWQEVKVENPQLDQAMQDQRVFLDTVGGNTDSEANQRLYGVTNIDSMKRALKANMDSFRKMQHLVMDSTWFDFRKNGTIYMHSDEGLDSASWYFEEDGALMLDETKMKGAGIRIRMEIETLSDTLLKMKFIENRLTVNTTFKPAKK